MKALNQDNMRATSHWNSKLTFYGGFYRHIFFKQLAMAWSSQQDNNDAQSPAQIHRSLKGRQTL